MARTRYTTLATQSILRTQAYAKKPGSSSSSMLLLHLSMLSLLPLLFDSAHGQSAYGYVRDSHDIKGKQREIHTSTACNHEEIPCPATTSQNHPANHPSPIIGFSSQASSSRSSTSTYPSSSHITDYPTTSSHRSFTPSHSPPSIPPSRTTLPPPAEARSRTSKSNTSSSSSNDIGELRVSVSAMLDNLLNNPIPSELPDGSLSSLQEMPIIQACKIFQEMISLDVREGKGALHTITDDTVALLLALADPAIWESSEAFSKHPSVLEHLHLRRMLRELPAINDEHGQSTSYSTIKEYSQILREECFAILDLIRHASIQETQKALQNAEAAGQIPPCTRLSDQTIAHASKIALTPRDLSFVTTAWLSHKVLLEPFIVDPRGEEAELESTAVEHITKFNEMIWPLTKKALDISHLQTSLQVEEYTTAVSAYAAIFDSVKTHIPSKRRMYATLLQALLKFPVPPTLAESISGKTSKQLIEQANLSIAQHETLFKDTHAFLLQITQELISSKSKPYTISYTKHRWNLRKVTNGNASQESAATKTLDPGAAHFMAQDLECLVVLLRYAYRHLQSSSTAERLYAKCVWPALDRQRKLQPMAEPSGKAAERPQGMQSKTLNVNDYIRMHQTVDSVRLRGATLQHRNLIAQQVLDDTVERLAVDAGMPEYCPDERPAKMHSKQAEEFEALVERRRKYWQVDILLRCPDVENDIIAAALAFWTATNQHHYVRYFMHHFFVIRRQVLLHSQTRGGLSTITLHSIEEEEIPPLGYEMEYSIAQSRMERMLSTHQILVTLLNTAERMGNVSLVEKCWLVACEEEDVRSNWHVPTAAYTLVLQAYGDEASHERVLADKKLTDPPSG